METRLQVFLISMTVLMEGNFPAGYTDRCKVDIWKEKSMSGKEEKIVSVKAPWTFSEMVPIIVALGIGLLAVFLYITDTWALGPTIFVGFIGFGLMVLLLNVNFGRKKKSTLFAEFDGSDDYGVRVWMRKPQKLKWNGKLDKDGKNIFNLVDTHKVTLTKIESTPVFVFSPRKGQIFYVPTRFLRDNEQLAQYVYEASKKSKWSVSSEAKALLTEYFPESDGFKESTVLEEEPAKVETIIEVLKEEEDKVAPESEPKPVVTPKKHKVLGYQNLVAPQKAVSELLDEALEAKDKAGVDEDEISSTAVSSRDVLGLSAGVTSVSVPLPVDTEEHK